jgi:hypothetical protein
VADPHKGSATIEGRDDRKYVLATGGFGVDTTSCQHKGWSLPMPYPPFG